MARTVRAVSRRSAKGVLRDLRRLRMEKDALEKTIPEKQALAIELLGGVDPENQGFKYTEEDPEGKVLAFVQQNKAQTYWDEESLVAWLQENGMWTECSTRVLDIKKVEALIAEQNTSPVTKKVLLGFVKVGDKPRPFVRFAKEK